MALSKATRVGGRVNYPYQLDDVAALRAFVTPPKDGDLVNLRAYDATLVVAGRRVLAGGGLFWYDATDTTSVDNGGTIIVSATGARYKRVQEQTGVLYAEWFGVSYARNDNSDQLKRAMDAARKKVLVLPAASMANPIIIRKPVVAQTNCGVKLRGGGVKDATAISAIIPAGYEEMGALHFPGKEGTSNVPGFAGIEISNIQLSGNLSNCHGIYLQYQYQSLYSYVNVEQFNGAGLFLDKCQDSVFNFFNVWDCGRTSGDRNSFMDTFDMTKTLHAPIKAVSTITNDLCNYLRFNDCQFEDNKVCPVMDMNWGIENSMNDCHIEFNANWKTAGAPLPYFLRMQQGVLKWTGGGCAEYYGVRHNFGELYMKDVRCSPALYYDMMNDVTSRARFDNISIQYVGNLARARFTTFNGCTFTEDITLGYPNSDVRFNGCTFNKAFNTTHSGSSLRMWIDACKFVGNVSIAEDTPDVYVDQSRFEGDVSFSSGGGMFLQNKVLGTLSIGVNVRVALPQFRQVFGTAAPASGSWRVGDLCWNTAPSAGGVSMWRCVTAGSPGTWRATVINP